MSEILEPWRQVWRHGIVPCLSRKALESLAQALRENSLEIRGGATTTPPPLPHLFDWPVESACAIAYCGWRGEGLETVGEVEEYFTRICHEADELLGRKHACSHFLNWFDDTPWETVRRELLAEVELALQTEESHAAG